MTAIGPGDWVECVDASPPKIEGAPYLVAGQVYLVERVKMVLDRRGQNQTEGLVLVGVRAEPHAYDPKRFRPIYRPKADLIERLMQPVPDEPVKVKA